MSVAKVRNEPELAGIRIGSAVGEKLPALITEKAKNPRCFKNEMSLTCMYKAQTKSWMESETDLQSCGSKILNSVLKSSIYCR